MAKIDLLPSLIIEYATLYKNHHHSLSSRLRHRLCFYYCTTLLTVLILGLNVFCVHHSTTTVNSLRLLNLRVGLNVPNLSIDMNVSLSISITATNPNHVSFRFDVGSAQLSYSSEVVGAATIPPTRLGPRSNHNGCRLDCICWKTGCGCATIRGCDSRGDCGDDEEDSWESDGAGGDQEAYDDVQHL